MERLKLVSRESCIGQSNDDEADSKLSALRSGTDANGINFIGGPFSW